MSDAVNHPPHYRQGGIEVIDFIEALGLGYHLGNTIKYIARAGIKTPDPLEDLKKAQWYLTRKIAQLEAKAEPLKHPAQLQGESGPLTSSGGVITVEEHCPFIPES